MILAEKVNKDTIQIGSVNTNIVLQETLQAGYIDITSIENAFYNSDVFTDYLQMRDFVKSILNTLTWSGCSNLEKDLIIELYLKEDSKTVEQENTEKVTYLMSKGYSLTQAQGTLIQSYSKHHIKEIESCTSRANNELLFIVIAKYLTIQDAGDLIRTTYTLFELYKSQGIKGTLDGSAGEGLFDFIESTVGTTYENTGLEEQGYVLNTGTYSDFRNELMSILRGGNY